MKISNQNKDKLSKKKIRAIQRQKGQFQFPALEIVKTSLTKPCVRWYKLKYQVRD